MKVHKFTGFKGWSIAPVMCSTRGIYIVSKRSWRDVTCKNCLRKRCK